MKNSNWMNYLLDALCAGLRCLISLRYRLKIKGLQTLTPDLFTKEAGIVFLPNHPAEIDPIILEVLLWRKFRLRPLIVEHFYYLKGFRFFLDLVGALPLPTMDHFANKWREKKVKQQFNHIVDALKKKGNFLIYPSGRLKLTGLELIGGASFIHNLVEALPEVHIVLVRTTGLWGSQFSRALTGSSPDFGKTLWNCFKILLKNGIFFVPRRDVLIEFELAPKDFLSRTSRLEFNKYLEDWYNRYPEKGAEPLRLVSFAFWKKEFPEVYELKDSTKTSQERPVPLKIQEGVFSYLAKLSHQPLEKIERTMHLSHDLGLDSLDIVQIYVFLDEQYSVTDLIPGDLVLIEDVLQAAAGYKRERIEQNVEKKKAFKWPEEQRLPPVISEARSIQEAFLKSVDRLGSQIACADRRITSMSYRKFKMAALLLSIEFKKIEEDCVAVMLPSSVSAYLVIIAVLLAKKVPVMLNWTAGIRSLDHAMDLTGFKSVITASQFLDRLENADLGKIEDHFLFLEDIKDKIGSKNKLHALFLSFFKAKTLLKKLNLNTLDSSDPCVILFTSGTENLPKAVPLSHENILSNQRACLEVATLNKEDILYGVLPPFHSFGFSITGVLPLLAGLRICYAPDPTDSHGMAKDIAEYKPTLFCCAPSFIKALFRIAKPTDLQSLRLIVAGAEKAPLELFDYVSTHLSKAKLLEGYGITECSPVVTIDRPNESHVGVGKPLPNLEVKIINSATHTFLKEEEEGEIMIAGPSVFSGYLGHSSTPFLQIEGKNWYISGDRGHLDKEGHLILSGRLKRFVKIGGEMVSLAGLEEELISFAKEKQWMTGKEEGPVLAVSACEKQTDKPELILFTTFTISKEEINILLKQSGFGRIVKIAEIRQLKEIPLTGTGKTNYRFLDELIG